MISPPWIQGWHRFYIAPVVVCPKFDLWRVGVTFANDGQQKQAHRSKTLGLRISFMGVSVSGEVNSISWSRIQFVRLHMSTDFSSHWVVSIAMKIPFPGESIIRKRAFITGKERIKAVSMRGPYSPNIRGRRTTTNGVPHSPTSSRFLSTILDPSNTWLILFVGHHVEMVRNAPVSFETRQNGSPSPSGCCWQCLCRDSIKQPLVPTVDHQPNHSTGLTTFNTVTSITTTRKGSPLCFPEKCGVRHTATTAITRSTTRATQRLFCDSSNLPLLVPLRRL